MNTSRFVFTIEDCLNTLSRFSVASSSVEYCDLRTVAGLDKQDCERRSWLNSPYTAATKRGRYLSIFEVSGAFKEMDEASDQTGPGSLESLITSMNDSLNTAYKDGGHKINCVFERDPEMGREEIEDMVAPQKRSLANTDIQLQGVVGRKVTILSPRLVQKRCWLTIWSGPDLISNSDRTTHGELVRRLVEWVPGTRFAQSPWQWTLSALKIRHEAFLDNVEQALGHSSNDLILRLLGIHEAKREIRRQTERYSTLRSWQPHLPGDAQPTGYHWTDDEFVLHAPPLYLQLFSMQMTTQGNLVQAGGPQHGMVSITSPPQNLQTFNELVRAIPRAILWRIRMGLMPSGMKALNLKKTLLTYSSFISAVRSMYESAMTLAATNEKEPVCIMTITASTQGKTHGICARDQVVLKSATGGWGVCDTTTTFGNPRRAQVNTILTASGGSDLVPPCPPLPHAISLFPFNRVGSVW